MGVYCGKWMLRKGGKEEILWMELGDGKDENLC